MNKYLVYGILFLSMGCSVKKVAHLETQYRSWVYDKVRITYFDGVESNTFKGKIAVTRDSLVTFKIYGSLGVEVLACRYDSTFMVKSQYLSDQGFDLPGIVYRDLGLKLSRKMLEYFLSFEEVSLYNEIVNAKQAGVVVEFFPERREGLISIRNPSNGYSYRIMVPKERNLPAESHIDFDLAGRKGEIKFEFLSVQY